MDTISLKIPITIKAKLTDKLRARIVSELTDSLKRVEMELSQLDIQERQVLAEQGHNDIHVNQYLHLFLLNISLLIKSLKACFTC